MQHNEHSEEQWRDLIAEQARSGLTHREFAEEHGLQLKTFRHWLYKLRDQGKKRARPQKKRFVELKPARSVSSSKRDAAMTLVTAQARIEFQELPPPTYVSGLLSALGKLSS